MGTWLCKNCGKGTDSHAEPSRCVSCGGGEFVPKLLSALSGSTEKIGIRRTPTRLDLVKSFKLKYAEYGQLLSYEAYASTDDVDRELGSDETTRRSKIELREIATECRSAGVRAHELGISEGEYASLASDRPESSGGGGNVPKLIALGVVVVVCIGIAWAIAPRGEVSRINRAPIVDGGSIQSSAQIIANVEFSSEPARAEGANVGWYQTAFNSSAGCRVLIAPGTSWIEVVFELRQVPSDSWLTLNHLSSASAGVRGGGYAPVKIIANRSEIARSYDVAEQHGGSHGFNADSWNITSLLKKGKNTLRIEYESHAITHYWIKNLQIRGTMR